jgi:hypothetical protein
VPLEQAQGLFWNMAPALGFLSAANTSSAVSHSAKWRHRLALLCCSVARHDVCSVDLLLTDRHRR